MSETLKSRVNRGDRLIAYAVSRLFHHNLIQMVANHGGFNALWIDVEHAGLSTRDLELAAIAARSVGIPNFVRIPPTDYATVTRCLESGADGVMAAQIHSADEAEQFVEWAKFAPRGCRGLNTGGYDGRYGLLPAAQMCESANRDNFVAIQIETAQSVDECDAIAALDGVDLLFVGPADLSLALGVPGQFMHADCLSAIDKVAAACKRHGKHWGAVTPTPEHAAMALEKGCTLLSPTNDIRLMNAGIAATKDAFRLLFG
jgi:4-hydroxy-2-oxoheptanedioate aldolase